MASRSQIRKLFVRMYSADTFSATSPLKANGSVHSSTMSVQPNVVAKLTNGDLKKANGTLTPPSIPKEKVIPLEELMEIAEQFAERLPEGEFTPAEVQGFLLTRKKEPKRALDEVGEWRDNLQAAKAAKTKLTPSQ
ncbi:MAG: hypothetical protein Q9187_006766 [Circinaria calcarea]